MGRKGTFHFMKNGVYATYTLDPRTFSGHTLAGTFLSEGVHQLLMPNFHLD
jgi:hypothetical protein